MHFTYILSCHDNVRNRRNFYVGVTEDITNRLSRHKNKQVKTTKSFDKVELVYYEMCLNKTDALKRELQLKTGFGRAYIKRRLENYLAN